MKPIVFRAVAAREYEHQASWYEAQRPGLGLEFSTCVDAALQAIQRNVALSTLVTASVRRILVQRFPFGIYFRNHRDSIEVIGIRHFRMRPLLKRRRRS